MKTRTGPIHRFAPDATGPTLAAFSAAFSDGKTSVVPVQVIDPETLKPFARGSVTSTSIEGSDLIGTVEWPDEVEALASLDEADPQARCHFSDGRLARVTVEMDAGDHLVYFRKWDKAARDALDKSDFAGPSQSYPIEDQEDLDSAVKLYGKAEDPEAVKAEIIRIGRRKGLTLPEAWGEKKVAMSGASPVQGAVARHLVAFDLGKPVSEDDWVVYPDSLLFRQGDYPSHAYAMSREELKAAAEAFSEPVLNEYDHDNTEGKLTILDGKFGHVASVKFVDKPEGAELRGVVKIPKWLDQVWDSTSKQVSCVWDRGTKTLQRLGLVVNGRVEGAALFSAFSAAHPKEAAAAFAKDRTYQGMSLLQSLHDTSAAGGAVCKSENSPARFHSMPEVESLQAIHDETCKGGAHCRILGEKDGEARYGMFAAFTPRKRTDIADKHHQLIHDVISTGYPGACTGGPMGRGSSSDQDQGDTGNDVAMGDDTEQHRSLRKIHAMTVENRATCPGKSMTKMSGDRAGSPNLARFAMSKYAAFLEAVGKLPDTPTDDQMLACFRAAPRDTIDLLAKEAPPDPMAAFADNPVIKQLIADRDALKAKDDARDKAEVMAGAVAFADPAARRLALNEEHTVVLKSLLFNAAEVDRKQDKGLVAFAVGGAEKTLGIADAVKLLISARPDSPLIRQQIAENGGELPAEFSVKRIGHAAMSAAEDQAENDRLLSMTEDGRAALERKRQERKAV